MVQAHRKGVDCPKLFEPSQGSLTDLEDVIEKMCGYSQRPQLNVLNTKIKMIRGESLTQLNSIF